VAGFAAGEPQVFWPIANRTHRPFRLGVTDRQIAIFEIAIQHGPLIERIRRHFVGQALRKKDFWLQKRVLG